MTTPDNHGEAIAIIGMAGRFPKAENLDAFWRNLREGVETISFFNNEELEWSWIDGPPPKDNPAFVKARGVLENSEWFDADFFHMTPREADVMDPQHRVFLECAWEALENAGYTPESIEGLAGVFAGSSMNTYLLANLLSHRPPTAVLGDAFKLLLATDKDFLTTRVSYKLNLQGPSVNVQTACSTSLMAVCLACQSLLSYQCDLALAGGVAVAFPKKQGKLHQEGGVISPDGHCRAFDAEAGGTIFGDGAGIVVLKRLADAQADGDRICAVIRGSAINNDGARKVGYSAPSVDGQAEVVAMAHAAAGVDPSTISYVEAHGTATPMGDPIEIAGLTKAFGRRKADAPTCAIGTVKANIGHLDVAAGIAGLIKTVLALQHRELPPLLHFQSPNPKIDFANSPFYPNTTLKEWTTGAHPRRAGVSAFGIGGTNAHVVLEEAPACEPSTPAQPWQLLTVSARSAAALDQATKALAVHLAANPSENLADVAHTLRVGRKAFAHRRTVVCRDGVDAVSALNAGDAAHVATDVVGDARPVVSMMFPGQGSQHVDMARGLYETEPVFRDAVDRSCELLRPHLGLDLRTLLYPKTEDNEAAARQLAQTSFTQPALFVIEHALATFWMESGVRPQSLIGHSLGEYVAACVAGVFSLEDALRLVATRARLMQAQAPGVMLAVRSPESAVQALLVPGLSLAAVNAPELCVVSGTPEAIAVLEHELERRGIAGRRLATSHAFHSEMMEPVMPAFAEVLKETTFNAPKIAWISNVTGAAITAAQAMDPNYWLDHLRQPVRFADGLSALAASGVTVFLEVGPGQTLCGLARQHPAISERAGQRVVPSLPSVGSREPDRAMLLKACGRLWLSGVTMPRAPRPAEERRRRVALPTYPFERKRHWIEPAPHEGEGPNPMPPLGQTHNDNTHYFVNTIEGQPTDMKPTAHPEPSRLNTLKALFQELSGLEMAHANESATFIELGLDSLLLTQASQAVETRFGVKVTLRQMLDGVGSLEKLAAHIEEHAPVRAETSLAEPAAQPVAQAGEELTVPLTAEQHEVWFASQMSTEASAAYNESFTLRLTGALDIEDLNVAIQQLIARHDALRATFSAAGDYQRITPALEIDLPIVDFSHLSTSEQQAQVEALINERAGEPFDLINGPLLRVQLIRVAAEEHRLVFVAHHLINDGWSQGILLCDLGELYSARRRRGPAALTVPAKFSAFASTHDGRRDTPVYVAAENYWVEQFANSVPVLELPADHARPGARTYAAGCRSRTFSPELLALVKGICEARGCTPFSLLLSTFSAMLHRLSAQDDLVIGVPAAGQVMEGLENMVGHCANLLPIRSRCTDDLAFGDFLATGKSTLLAGLENWQYPFGDLIRKLNLPRDANRVPLVNVVFNFSRLRNTPRYEGLEAKFTSNPKSFLYFDLFFDFTATDDELTLNAHYSAELFRESTVDRFIGILENLLRGIASDTAMPVSRLPLLNDQERHRILVEWNDTAMEFPRDKCIHELFAEQAARTPQADALVFGTERLTYGQLDRWSDAIARRLRAAGVGPEQRVGIFLTRTPALIAALLGVLKSGGAYVPLDPAYPRDRLGMILEDSQPKVLVTSKALPALEAVGAETLLMESIDPDEPAPDAQPAADRGNGSRNLAYVLYTSGSTGRPKGVEIEHRSVVAFVAWAMSAYQPDEYAGVLATTSVCFDLSVYEIFFPLCAGAKVILAENILHLPELPALSEITLINTVPSAMIDLLQVNGIPNSIGTINSGGEALPQDLVNQLYAQTAVKRVVDCYGPTETTVYSTVAVRRAGEKHNIGRPFANEEAYILDRFMQPVPVGVTGELYLGGVGLARGYRNLPDMTREKFVPSPFAEGARLYRTGDRARYREDGVIEYLGRLDYQIKLRGHRIELGDIESALRRHPSVREAVAIVRTDKADDPRLVAYVVSSEQAAEANQLRAHLMKTLPGYMIPAAFIVLEKMPLTPNGKVDRKALPAPDSSGHDDCQPYVAPRTTTEEVLADIWREVLGVEQVGVEDNFFDSGGHSLMATRVLSRVREAFQVELSFRRFFESPVISDQAAAIEQAMVEEIQNMAGDNNEQVVAETATPEGRTL